MTKLKINRNLRKTSAKTTLRSIFKNKTMSLSALSIDLIKCCSGQRGVFKNFTKHLRWRSLRKWGEWPFGLRRCGRMILSQGSIGRFPVQTPLDAMPGLLRGVR